MLAVIDATYAGWAGFCGFTCLLFVVMLILSFISCWGKRADEISDAKAVSVIVAMVLAAIACGACVYNIVKSMG